ncbi:MAG TPA: relaxase/mobilization nuclease domain-containing protein [Puia sp.]|nr:relaxase/mobilization nuclease domain-containing protein [Puia sp.]
MRPKIMACHNIAHSITYNENKLKQGRAECLTAANFLKDPSRLSLEDKLHRFEKRMELNDRVSTNLHITLNFDPLDNLSNEQMAKIAGEYMKEIGFERQPYLVYRHADAGHPHCHIITTHVQKNGDPIDLYKIGENQSEKARLKLEAEYGLVTTETKRELRRQELQERQRQQQQEYHRHQGVSQVNYGEKSLARSISDVVEHVTEKFAYTSLEELNIILRQYRVEADGGKEGTKLYQDRGLRYRALDEQGRHIGRPINAGFFDCKPTLANLEKKFVLNQAIGQRRRQHIENRVAWALCGKPDNLEAVKEELSQNGIAMVLDRDKDGDCRRADYVDFRNRIVCTGKALGSRYDHEAIQQVIDRERIREAQQSLNQTQDLSLEQTQQQSYRYRPSLW